MFCNCDRLPYIRHIAGSTFDKVLTISGADEEPIEFSPDAVAEFWLATLTLEKVADFTATILPSPALGQIRLQLPASATANRSRRYLWSCSIDNGAEILRLASNQFYLEV